jgi:hypothetical protein
MISPNAGLHEMAKIVTGLAPIAPSSSTPDYVSLKGYHRACVVILQDNGTAPTGSAITLKQATAVAGTGEKALSFSKVYVNTDTAAAGGDALTETTVTNDTFTTDNTADKNAIYVIEVDEQDLDIDSDFDCIRVGTANATNSVLSVLYVLYPAKYAANPNPIAAITD